MRRWSEWPLGQLVLARVREFYREPEAVFWVYGFPILMTVLLGIAFREAPDPQYRVDVVGPGAAKVIQALNEEKTRRKEPRYLVQEQEEVDAARGRLRAGKTDLVVTASGGGYEYEFVPTRPESRLARVEAN